MQLEKLVMDPLHAAIREESFHMPRRLLDALDECKDEMQHRHPVKSVGVRGRLSPSGSSLRVDSVERLTGISRHGLITDTNSLVLHNIPLDISQKDIRVYLEKRLSRIPRSLN